MSTSMGDSLLLGGGGGDAAALGLLETAQLPPEPEPLTSTQP